MADKANNISSLNNTRSNSSDDTANRTAKSFYPSALDPTITGTPTVGSTLTVSYSYTHEKLIQEKESVIKWFSASDVSCKQDVKLLHTTSEANPTYQLKASDAERYIFCSVEPHCDSESNNIGQETIGYYEYIIRTTATAPSGYVSSPSENGAYTEGSTIQITVEANCLEGAIEKVVVFLDSKEMAVLTTAPYSYAYSNAIKGTHTAHAVVYSASGEAKTTARVNFACISNDIYYEYIGNVHKKTSAELNNKYWSIGCEALDRDMAVYANYKDYVGLSGANRMRLQGGWAKCEKTKGVYDFSWIDESVDDALTKNVKSWIDICYGNSIYNGGGGTTLDGGFPSSDEALQAWDNWVRALVTHFKGRVDEWEVWNESDHGGIPISSYTAFFIRTSDIIKEVQPEAKIIGVAGASIDPSNYKAFLSGLESANKLDNVDVLTVHGYPGNPDTNTLPALTAVCDSFSTDTHKIEMWVGETGAPHKSGGVGASPISGPTELKQSKWVARRMLSARANSVPISIFSLVDLYYNTETRVGMNYKGLIHSNPSGQVIGQKQAFLTYRNIVSVFNESIDNITADYPCAIDTTLSSVHCTAYQNIDNGKQLLALWDNSDAPTNSTATTPCEITVENGNFDNPVYIDLGTGKVYNMSGWVKDGTKYTFKDVPLYDSPIVIADASAVDIDINS